MQHKLGLVRDYLRAIVKIWKNFYILRKNKFFHRFMKNYTNLKKFGHFFKKALCKKIICIYYISPTHMKSLPFKIKNMSEKYRI
jgi:hypothetical protein